MMLPKETTCLAGNQLLSITGDMDTSAGVEVEVRAGYNGGREKGDSSIWEIEGRSVACLRRIYTLLGWCCRWCVLSFLLAELGTTLSLPLPAAQHSSARAPRPQHPQPRLPPIGSHRKGFRRPPAAVSLPRLSPAQWSPITTRRMPTALAVVSHATANNPSRLLLGLPSALSSQLAREAQPSFSAEDVEEEEGKDLVATLLACFAESTPRRVCSARRQGRRS
ncbi:hypothetical protein GE09DRAFT_586307 [Coniochaeta sp. 2T2.1]|nr:hypothetical protein GE09DRAFT_586307 [Coniochaeta sp. 2T2.1]